MEYNEPDENTPLTSEGKGDEKTEQDVEFKPSRPTGGAASKLAALRAKRNAAGSAEEKPQQSNGDIELATATMDSSKPTINNNDKSRLKDRLLK